MSGADTIRRLARDTAPATLQAIRDGTASTETRRAFALGLLTAASESLAAGPMETQADWLDTASPGARPSAIQGTLF
jgi:hypothetical protein